MERKNKTIMTCFAGAVLLLDQAIKQYIRRFLLGESILEIPGFVRITHCINTGGAFSILSGRTVLLAVVSIGLLVALCVYVFREMRLTLSASVVMGCLIGGGLGNLTDRVVFTGVTDYIQLLLFDFPIFNLADIAITCSIACLLLMLFLGKLEESTGENNESSH